MHAPLPDHVRIVRAPFGEAPEWVREAWVGLDLPLLQPELTTLTRCGVLSGPPPKWRVAWEYICGRPPLSTGYVVSSARAIALLAEVRPAAADWWRDNAPKFLRDAGIFLFDTPACRPVRAARNSALAA